MPCTCVVGLQWGDEAKGKIVDLLDRDQHDFVVRYNGGANAGHTVVADGKTFKLSLLPTGVLSAARQVGHRQRRRRLPAALPRRGRQPARRPASRSATTSSSATTPTSSSPTTWKRSASSEAAASRRSAPPAAASARATRTRSAASTASASANCSTPNTCANGCAPIVAVQEPPAVAALSPTPKQFDADALCRRIPRLRRADAAARHRHDAAAARRARRRASASCSRRPRAACSTSITAPIPYVTSSNSSAAGIWGGSRRAGAKHLTRIIGVIKAYTTRVGGGPFPTELDDGPTASARRIRKIGREYGTVTGRPRRCGWFDAVAVRYSAALGGADELTLMLLDVLSGLDEVEVCTAYELDGERIDHFPGDAFLLALQAGLRDAAGLEGGHHGGAQAGRPAGGGAALRRPAGRADRAAGGIVSVGPDRAQPISPR